MKKVIATILILAIIFLFVGMFAGCAKKTYQLDSAKVSKQSKTSSDSTGQKKTITDDHTVTTTSRDIDTSLNIAGNPIGGTILPGMADAHFENDDVSLDLHTDPATGRTSATATPKKKKVPFKLHENTTVASNVQTTSTEHTKLKTRSDIKTDSTARHEVKHVDPTVTVQSLRTVVIWFLVIIGVIGLVFYFGRKYFNI